MKYKLAILDSHPIQYRAPLFKKLAQHPQIDLCVYYCSNFGTTEKLDPGFGIKFKWDISLLEGYRYQFLKNYSFNPSLNRYWGLLNTGIIGLLRKKRHDAILIYGYFFGINWLVSLLSRIHKVPIFFIGETVPVESSRKIKNMLLKLFFKPIKAYFFIGSKSYEFYRRLKIPEERFFFTPYCVDNAFFTSCADKWRSDKEQIKKEIGIPQDLPVILYASKMILRKRPQDALKAFKNICTKAALVFIGDGQLKPSLEDYVQHNKIKNVFFLGFKNQTELPRYYAIADIFVFPSSYEPWGLSINEAMCAGLPIITTDKVAAAYDLVKEGNNGYIFKVGDIEGLTRLLEDLVSNAEKRKDMGLKSLEIISDWNYDVCVKGIIKALEFISLH